MTPPPPITRLGAQRAARHELSKAIYHRNSDPLVLRALRWLGRQFDRLIGRALHHAPSGGFGALTLVVVVAVAVAIAFAVWRVGPVRRSGAVGSVLDTGARQESASDHRRRAEEAASAGEFSTAVIERMRATARELEERGILEGRPGRTASELSHEAGIATPAAADALHRAAATFNSIAYGAGEADRPRYDVMVAADEAVRHSGRVRLHS